MGSTRSGGLTNRDLWLRCWSVARITLHLTDLEFYDLTPRNYHALLDRHREHLEHQEWLSGIIAATVANHSMNPPKEWMKAADFMPSHSGVEVKRVRSAPTKAQRAAIADSVRAFFMPLVENA